MENGSPSASVSRIHRLLKSLKRRLFLLPWEVVHVAIRKLKKYKPTKFKAKDSRYDEDAAAYAVSFIECLCHTKGTWAGKPFELIDW